jgi:signal transduction histidine kinase
VSTSSRRAPSFRTRILVVVLAVGVAPLGLLGLWLSGSAVRTGETLLQGRLAETLDRNAAAIEIAWIAHRTALLDLGDRPEVRSILAAADVASEAATELAPDAGLLAEFASLDPAIQGVTVRDAAGTERLRLTRADEALSAAALFGPPLAIGVPLHDRASGQRVGTLEASLPLHALHDRVVGPAGAGVTLTAFEPGTGVLLRPVPFDAALLAGDRFAWADDEWLTARRAVVEPRVDLVAAGALGPYTAPFHDAARRGVGLLLLVAVAGTVLAAVLASRLTASLGRLATAADAVSTGDLDRRVDPAGPPEVGRVATAFNTMTANLRRTLARLAERESLVAVNEFAAALAHEVRNPLSSIQLDLQEVEERLPADSPLRALQLQALDDLRRLDRTVAAALGTARAGRLQPREFDLRDPVRAAARAAAPRCAERGATLHSLPDDAPPVPLHGDPDALERVFLNLLLNAADAVDTGGTVRIEVDGGVPGGESGEGAGATVVVRDDGDGMSPDALTRAFEPFFSTRAGGTGVGLSIARRIVAAHGGTLHLDSAVGRGTAVEVRLPAGAGSFAATGSASSEQNDAAGPAEPARSVSDPGAGGAS